MLPRARVVYCSATGVSEVGNMAYMTRLGLWGPGSAFSDFEVFLDSMKKRGVSFMEMLAMELKAEGNYVARGLSFRLAVSSCSLCTFMPAAFPAGAMRASKMDHARHVIEFSLQSSLKSSESQHSLLLAVQLHHPFRLFCKSYLGIILHHNRCLSGVSIVCIVLHNSDHASTVIHVYTLVPAHCCPISSLHQGWRAAAVSLVHHLHLHHSLPHLHPSCPLTAFLLTLAPGLKALNASPGSV